MIAMIGSCGIGLVGAVSTAFGCSAAATGEAVIAAAPVATPAALRNEPRLTVFIVWPPLTPTGDVRRSFVPARDSVRTDTVRTSGTGATNEPRDSSPVHPHADPAGVDAPRRLWRRGGPLARCGLGALRLLLGPLSRARRARRPRLHVRVAARVRRGP